MMAAQNRTSWYMYTRVIKYPISIVYIDHTLPWFYSAAKDLCKTEESFIHVLKQVTRQKYSSVNVWQDN